MVLPSRAEGGANVISEAVAAGVPVLATDIPGNKGLLGADYAGYFPVGDAPALAVLMQRLEAEPAFLERLRAQVLALQPAFSPAHEQAAWAALLQELPRASR